MKLTKVKAFTLIEFLIVILIVSIVSGVVLLSITHSGRQAKVFAKELTDLILLAEQQAILEPAILMLSFQEGTFEFFRFEPNINDAAQNPWVPTNDYLLGKHTIPYGINVTLNTNMSLAVGGLENSGQADQTKQQNILISMNGELSPFTIYIGQNNHQASYAIVGKKNGQIVAKQLDS